MIPDIKQIYASKVEEIQSRLPSQVTVHTNFSSVLNSEIEKVSPSNSGNTSSTSERINDAIDSASEKYNISADLIRAVVSQESSFNPSALSSSGAQGLMQLMPSTANMLGVTNPWNIEQNINGGTKYLSQQLSAFNGDLSLALAAYNAGPNAVKKYGGVPPYSETQNYVNKIMSKLK